MSKYQLPPRKWYTLEQAAKQITKLTGEEFNIDDLLHFAFINKLELCCYIKYQENQYFEIDGEKRRYLIIDEKEYKPVAINLIISDIAMSEILDNNPEAVEEYYTTSFAEINEKYAIFQISRNIYNANIIDVTKYNGLVAVYLDGSRMPSDMKLDKTISIELAFKWLELGNVNSQIKLPRSVKKPYISFDVKTEANYFSLISEISIENLLISTEEIIFFLNGGKSIQPTYNEIGRPKHTIKSLVSEIARETFKYNPNQSPNKISSAIYDYIEKVYSKEYGTISQRTIYNYLKSENIGKEKAQNKEKVTIKDPFRTA